MKNALFPLLISVLFQFSAQSQVLEETRVMAAGSEPALTINIPGADPKFVETKWKEYMKSYGKMTRVKQSKEFVASDVQILDIGGVNRLNVYGLAEESGEGTKMTIWFDMGGAFLSSDAYPKEYVSAVNFVKDFAQKVKVDMITEELEAQEKLVTKAENNLTRLKRENEMFHKIIEDSKKRIAQAEEDIQKNLKDQEVAHKEIEVQKEVLGGVQKKLEECKNQ